MDTIKKQRLYAIVPAAGVGSRMKTERPKQYLLLHGKTILEHTVEKLLNHQFIEKVVIAVSQSDPYFSELNIAHHPDVIRVEGGRERANSVLSGLNALSGMDDDSWVLVHDAARPCVSNADISTLISKVTESGVGGILAAPVRDTMKRGDSSGHIANTIERDNLWHALTPQMFKLSQLKDALVDAEKAGISITDEASVMEWKGFCPQIVLGRMDNLKITQPEDLALAEFYLSREQKEQQ